MICRCPKPKKLKNDAHGKVFYVCAKSQGGCGEEISEGSEKPLINPHLGVDWAYHDKFKVPDTEVKLSNHSQATRVGNKVVIHMGGTEISRYKLVPGTAGACSFPCCNEMGTLRRQNTNYQDEDSNYAILCKEHQDEADEFWGEAWAEYYSSVL